MNRFLLILFSIQLGTMSFLEAGLIGEIFKLPALLDHHSHHQQSGESDLWTFITTHYWGTDADDTDHESFPFQQCSGGHFVKCVPTESFTSVIHHFFIAYSYSVPRKEISIDSYESLGIWQPPSAKV